MSALRRASPLGRVSPLLLYPLVALLNFPTLGILFRGSAAWVYSLDVLDDGGGVPRLGMAVRDWAANGPTLWNPYLTGGNAFVAQFALPPYSPDVALAFVVGPFWAFAITTWLLAVVAGIGTHLFLRDRVGLVPAAVVGGAVMATLCFWHPILGISIAILPLLLWLGDQAIDGTEHRRRYLVGYLLAATLSLYAGLAQTAVFVAAIQLAWLVMTRPGARRMPLIVWAGTWAIAFALYAPILLTQLIMLPISQRTIWDLDFLYPGGVVGAATTVIRNYLSALLAIPIGSFHRSEPRYGTIFLGGIGLLCAIVAVVAGRRDRKALFFLAMLVAVPLIDFLANAVAGTVGDLGPLTSFQFRRIRNFFPFVEAGIVALGIDAMVGAWLAGRPDDGASEGRPPAVDGPVPVPMTAGRRRLVIAAGAIAVLAVGLEAAIAVRRAAHHVLHFTGQPIDIGYVILATALVAGLVGGGLLLVAAWRNGRTVLPGVVTLILVLFVLERATLVNGSLLTGPQMDTYDNRLALTPAQAFLLAQPGIEHERVLTFGDHANRQGFQGLRQVDGYQAIYPLAYHDFFGALTAPGLEANPARWNAFHKWGGRAYAFYPQVDPELTSLAGARWLYVVGDSLPTVPGIVERFRDGNVRVFENPAAFPRAFIVGRSETVADTPAMLRELRDASLDELRGTAWLTARQAKAPHGTSPYPGMASFPFDGQAGPAGTATLTLDTPDRVEMDVQPTRPGVLVLTDTDAPGWVAEVDGQAAPIYTVDGAFRGIALPAGARHVVFRYGPGFTYVGLLIAALGLLVAIPWIWFMGRRRASAARTPVAR